MRLLLVEDHDRLAGFIIKGMAQAGYSLDRVATLDEAQAALATTRFDALVLDLGLPDGDGLDLLKSLRSKGAATPVLVLTARTATEEKVLGLDSGADDYLSKPFEMSELIARIKALLRRPGEALTGALRLGDLQFDPGSRETRVGEALLSLSRRETDLLELMLRRAGRVVPKDVIEENLYSYDAEIASNSVEVHVHRLRKKLSQASATVTIHTMRGLGYVLSQTAV